MRSERASRLCSAWREQRERQLKLQMFLVDIWVYEIFVDEGRVWSLKPLEERWRSGESGPESIRASTRAMPVEVQTTLYLMNTFT